MLVIARHFDFLFFIQLKGTASKPLPSSIYLSNNSSYTPPSNILYVIRVPISSWSLVLPQGVNVPSWFILYSLIIFFLGVMSEKKELPFNISIINNMDMLATSPCNLLRIEPYLSYMLIHNFLHLLLL